jgi:hypothetical protein
MPAVFAIGDGVVAEVELSLHDVFHIYVLNCTQLGILGLASFVRMADL